MLQAPSEQNISHEFIFLQQIFRHSSKMYYLCAAGRWRQLMHYSAWKNDTNLAANQHNE